MLPVVIGVMFIVFTLMYITPGDPVTTMMGGSPDAPTPMRSEDIEALRAEMGLDDPFLIQFVSFAFKVLRLDFGTSYHTSLPVFAEISARLPATLLLASLGLIIAVLMGIPLGIFCSIKQNSLFDGIASVLGLIALSIPNFWLGIMLIFLFAVSLDWLPISGFTSPWHWILPSLTLGLSSAGVIMRFTRSSMLELIRLDFIRTARAKGQKESIVMVRHALKNALIPIITVIGLQFGFLLGGCVLTEAVFAIPGLGQYMVWSVRARNYPVVQGSVLLVALFLCFTNLLVDILYAFVDPRVSEQYK